MYHAKVIPYKNNTVRMNKAGKMLKFIFWRGKMDGEECFSVKAID